MILATENKQYSRRNTITTAAMMATLVVAAVIVTFVVTSQSGSAIGPPGGTLYENTNFNNDPKHPGGRSLEVSTDIACLADDPHDFDNITSSITVTPGTIVVLYEDCDFGGKSETFIQHDNDLRDWNVILDNKASSIRIFPDDQSLGADHKELLARIEKLSQDIDTRFDAIDAELLVLKNRIGEPELLGDPADPDDDLSKQLSSVYAHANPDPFEVTIQTCMSIDAGADIAGSLGYEANATGEIGLGVDVYGNGVSLDLSAPIILTPPPPAPPFAFPTSIAVEGSIQGGAGVSTVACYEGVRVFLERDHTSAEEDLIDAYIGAADALQGVTSVEASAALTPLRVETPSSLLIEMVDALGLSVEALVDITNGMVDLADGIDGTDPSASLEAIENLTGELPLVGDVAVEPADLEVILQDLCRQADCPAPADLEQVVRDGADVLKAIKKTVDDIEDLVDGLGL